jgi:ADP-ribose pyrophosphatase
MKIISDTPPINPGYFKVHKMELQGKKKQPIIREYVNSNDAVCAVIYNTKNNKYVFVKQFRPGAKMDIIEICAGMMDHVGEEAVETMKREIVEETGYHTDTINQVVKPYFTSPGKTNEKITIYFATVSNKVELGGGAQNENEEITVIELTKEEIKNTDFIDGKTLFALSILKLK